MSARVENHRSDPDRAWVAYEPDARRPWSLALAAHLYRRAAFGANWGQLQQALSEGPQRTADRLLRPQAAEVAAFDRRGGESESMAGGSVENLQAWWLRRMIETPHPLLEKMTLFWHSHFALNAGGVSDPRLMQAHLGLLRSHALGSFDSLLRGIARDPAMFLWLGADRNRKASPNEGFVRPLLETFTLGPGHCTDQDVQAAARAFTGWSVLRGQLRYLDLEYDGASQRFLGREGSFAAQDIVRIVAEHPATAQTIVRRLYRWLISETQDPDDALLAPLVASFAGDRDIARLVETMLRSNLLFSPFSYRQKVKGPVELAVGMTQALEAMVSTTQLAQEVAGLGQSLCRPPTVKGWAGGSHWINTAALVGRHNLAAALLLTGKRYETKLDPWAVAQKHGRGTPEAAGRFLLELLVQDDLEPATRDALLHDVRTPAAAKEPGAALRRLAYVVMTLPEYHLS
ncbi:MAG: DUF1800 domain-containing protein [Planctomycetes bacterium]|jgi:uncharacterized protein (DUF1800 family)|nr:DUF1800 domain-containing protein [Planctomycetota bacterium]